MVVLGLLQSNPRGQVLSICVKMPGLKRSGEILRGLGLFSLQKRTLWELPIRRLSNRQSQTLYSGAWQEDERQQDDAQMRDVQMRDQMRKSSH